MGVPERLGFLGWHESVRKGLAKPGGKESLLVQKTDDAVRFDVFVQDLKQLVFFVQNEAGMAGDLLRQHMRQEKARANEAEQEEKKRNAAPAISAKL